MGQVIDLKPMHKSHFDIWADFTSLVAKNFGAILAEAQDFSASSMQANANLLNNLASARTVSAMILLQTRHAQAACEATLTQSKKFAELFNELSRDTVKSIMVGAERSKAPLKIPSVGKMLHAAE
ncbi:phasin family protein [Rhodoblastus sp.]